MSREQRVRGTFVTWDGPNQPFLKSLFLPQFRELASRGFHFDVMQFSWGPQPELSASDLGDLRLQTFSVPRRFFPASYGPLVLRGAAELARTLRKGEVILARSYLPAAMALLATRLRPTLRFMWDLDGFMPEERVEQGQWRAGGHMFSAFSRLEHLAVRRAERLVVRTEAAREVLLGRHGSALAPRVFVVPNGRDLSAFRHDAQGRVQVRQRLGLAPADLLVVSSGSIGPQYLPEAQVVLVEQLLRRRSDAHWLILTGMRDEAQALKSQVSAELRTRVHIESADPSEVPRWMSAGDLGLALRAATPSQRAVAPLKVAEYLLCGLPIVVTTGVGDLEAQLAGSKVALCVSGHDQAWPEVLEWVESWSSTEAPERRLAARRLGERWFSLDIAVTAYEQVLREGGPRG